jgi:uncharacterized protein with von Willebrand factor type A (vWA) domain
VPLQTPERSRETGRGSTRKREEPKPRAATAVDETRPLVIDLPALAASFGQRLHEADLPVTPAQSERFALSLELTRPTSLRRLYFATRAVFVTEPEQTQTFDHVFEEVFRARVGVNGDDEVTIEHALGAAPA